MEGVPEGTGPARPPRSWRKTLLLAVTFTLVAAYLVFRLVQGVLYLSHWLAGHL